MSIWFEGYNEIGCNMQQVRENLENIGEYFVGIVSLIPGLTTVALVEEGSDFVKIKTNEGLMKRTNISKHLKAEIVVLEYDEEYQAGQLVTTKTHYIDEFTASDTGVKHHIVLSDVEAPGFLGFFYQNFGKSSTGNAALNACKTYFEQQNP